MIVRFLVDNQLPATLAAWLREQGHEADHVLDLQLAKSKDNPIWQHTVRNLVFKKLEAVGLKNTKTGLWEGPQCDIVSTTKMLTSVMKELSQISANWPSPGPYLNHLWVYIDFRKGRAM